MHTRRVLVLGASYGSLLASKLLLAGHEVTLVCLPAEADLINREGTRVLMPMRISVRTMMGTSVIEATRWHQDGGGKAVPVSAKGRARGP